ncbi:unnamed protein product, partial [Prunus brigantina]
PTVHRPTPSQANQETHTQDLQAAGNQRSKRMEAMKGSFFF